MSYGQSFPFVPTTRQVPKTLSLAALKALDTGAFTQTNYNGALYDFISGDFTGLADDVTIIKADDTDIDTGAWKIKWLELTPQLYGATADGTSHPLSELFLTLGEAQAVYSQVTSLDQTIDWAAAQKMLSAFTNAQITFPPATYVMTDDLQVQSSGQSPTDGGLRIDGHGAIFTGSQSFIVDSCKRLNISGIDMSDWTLELRGCWWSSFKNLVFAKTVMGGNGTEFDSCYWSRFADCISQEIETIDDGFSSSLNAWTWNNCSFRGTNDQGFTNNPTTFITLNGNHDTQDWHFVDCDISYFDTVLDIDSGNLGEIEYTFNNCYFDTTIPICPPDRVNTLIVLDGCHVANDAPNAVYLRASVKGRVSVVGVGFSANYDAHLPLNFIPNGNFSQSLPTFAGAGLPVGASGGSTITSLVDVELPFKRYLNINQANTTSNTVRFRSRVLPYDGRYTCALVLRNADVGERVVRAFFGGKYVDIPISDTEWTLYTATIEDIAAGAYQDIPIYTNDGTAFNIDVAYAAICYGEKAPLFLPSPRTELNASATYNAPSIAAAGTATTTVSVTGAVLGDYAQASFSVSTQGLIVTASVTSADTVTVVLFNPTGSAIDLASATLRVKVIPYGVF